MKKSVNRLSFNYIYMFVMFIYMSQMTIDTGRMVGNISGKIFPFILPIVLTFILLCKNPISISKSFLKCTGIFVLWSIIIIPMKGLYNLQDLSFFFFLFYSLVIAYIHVQVYQDSLFDIIEDICVIFASISLPLWLFSVFFPSAASTIFSVFEPTIFGRNFLYLFNWMDTSKAQYYMGIMRNAGCSWEPGRFAMILCLGILINISKRGLTFIGNRNIYVLLLALTTTLSTTGYFITTILIVVFYLKKVGLKYFPIGAIVTGFAIFYIMQLDFMGEKIFSFFNFQDIQSELLDAYNYMESKNFDMEEGMAQGYLHAVDRIPSMYFEWQNFIHDPIIGYGLNPKDSYIVENISEFLYLTGGFVQIIGKFGCFVGAVVFYWLFQSAKRISSVFTNGSTTAVILCFILSSISYPIFMVPIYMALWMFGPFSNNLNIDVLENEEGADLCE